MPQDHTLQLHCPAKVNLALSVGSPRSNGMHPIASLMCALTFGDDLTLKKADRSSHFDIQFIKLFKDDDQPMGTVDWPLEKDLAFRALNALQDHVGRPLDVNVTLSKRIPAGAGLAGGSGNAAGLLVGLNALYDLNLSTQTLAELAATLGSDVIFMVHAMQDHLDAAIVSGLGEGVTPLKLQQVIHLVLIFPPFGCPTGKVYGTFDRLLAKTQNSQKQVENQRVQDLALQSVIQLDDPFNDLAIPACDVQPQLATLQKQLAQALKIPIHITGSGSTLYALATDKHSAQVTAKCIREQHGLKSVATQTL